MNIYIKIYDQRQCQQQSTFSIECQAEQSLMTKSLFSYGENSYLKNSSLSTSVTYKSTDVGVMFIYLRNDDNKVRNLHLKQWMKSWLTTRIITSIESCESKDV